MIDDIDRLIAAWMNHWQVYEATEQFPEAPDGIDLSDIDEAPADFRFQFVLEVLSRISHDPDNHLMQVLAAGPLENLLSDHGPTVIDRIESLAKADASFNLLLGGVWKQGMADDVWDRVQACRNEVW